MAYWFTYAAGLSAVTGWENVSGLTSMYNMFNGCTVLTALDLSGLDPSGIVDYNYAFASCSDLVTITVDPSWALAAGASGSVTFAWCDSLVGGNGTAYDGNNRGYWRMVIDAPGTPGYLTARAAS